MNQNTLKIQIRSDYLAVLVVPSDLTHKEARHIIEVVGSLPMPESPEGRLKYDRFQRLNNLLDPISGVALYNLRVKRNLTLRGLSRLSGVSNGYLSLLERGIKISRSQKCAEALASALGVGLEDILA